jgi:exopolyphosphatase/guanosine-5'-triphosphate,3'-diphosphate pyrophosphatase
VGQLARAILKGLGLGGGEEGHAAASFLDWAAKLHEIGISVAYSGYHKHSAYIINHADMPGFSRDEQAQLALLVQSHRRSLTKIADEIEAHNLDWNMVFALRIAALLYRRRADMQLPQVQARRQGRKFRLTLAPGWLARNPLTATALHGEIREWERIGFELKVPELEEIESGAELAFAG